VKTIFEGLKRSEAEEGHPLREAFASFINLNPEIVLCEFIKKQSLLPDLKKYAFINPWNDESIAILIPEKDEDLEVLSNTLSGKRLLPQFSAIADINENEICLEFVWGVYSMHDEQYARVRGRSFKFQYKEKECDCKFDLSSKDLLSLSLYCEAVYPKSATRSDTRNMMRIKPFFLGKYNVKEFAPLSFFMTVPRSLEVEISSVARALNSEMLRYDRKSPRIIVHDDEPDAPHVVNEESRCEFPASICAAELDPILHTLWASIIDSQNDAYVVLNTFRVLEFISAKVATDTSRTKIERILNETMNSNKNIAIASEEIGLEILDYKDRRPNKRRIAAIRRFVCPDKIYEIIKTHTEVLRRDQIFDGDVKIDALLSMNSGKDVWVQNYGEKIQTVMETLRNSIAHGNETEMGPTFYMTRSNLVQLFPYARLCEAVAEDLIFGG